MLQGKGLIQGPDLRCRIKGYGRDPYPLQRTRSAGRSSVILVYGVLAGIPVGFFLKSWVSGRRKTCKPACHAGLQVFNQYGSMLGFDMGKCVEMA